MSCLVPNDFCSSCGNAARSRAEYCLGTHEGGTCPHGGLRHNIAKIAADGHQLHADNREPHFFDISFLDHRQADHIAYALGLAKAAAEAPVVSGAELAERLGLQAPAELAQVLRHAQQLAHEADPTALRWAKLAQELAGLEAYLATVPAMAALLVSVVPSAGGPGLGEPLAKYAQAGAVSALARCGCPLPLADYLAAVRPQDSAEKRADLTARVAARLPGAFGRLADDPGFLHRVQTAALAPVGGLLPPDAEAWAAKHAAAHSLAESYTRRRIWQQPAPVALRPLAKAAAASDAATEALALDYAAQRLRTLDFWRQQGLDSGKLATALVVQHYA